MGVPFSAHFWAFCLTVSKTSARGRDEVFQPRSEVGLASSEVVVVVRMGGQGAVVALQVAGIVLLQGEEAAKAVAAFVEDEGG